jgi:hypothetical protein
MLNYLIYVSMADHLMSEKELSEILDWSRDWNTEHNLTGMLIYIEGLFINTEGRAISSEQTGRFMQVLEGPQYELDDLFNNIKKDSRHHHVTLLHSASIAERNFDDWQMGFKSLSLDEYRTAPGLFELDQTFKKITGANVQNLPLQILKSFYHRGQQQATLFAPQDPNQD